MHYNTLLEMCEGPTYTVLNKRYDVGGDLLELSHLLAEAVTVGCPKQFLCGD